MAEIGSNIDLAKTLLENNEVVVIPTETVYGLAANGLSVEAIDKIYAVKERPRNNPLILHVSSLEKVMKLVSDFPESARKLATAFWPGPLTLLLPKSNKVLDEVTAGSTRVAIRIPDHPLTLELLRLLSFPLAAPSANPSNYISPTLSKHVQKQIGDKIPYILEGGPCNKGLESTIVGFEEGKAVIYRQGAIPEEKIQVICGKLKAQFPSDTLQSPGQLKVHYSPKTPLVLSSDPLKTWEEMGQPHIGFLLFSGFISTLPKSIQYVLSEKNDLEEAASQLYAVLHEMDTCGYAFIIAEKPLEKGLGKALLDRLSRASVKSK